MTNTRSVFLIMPFDEEFDNVYRHFMKPTLESVGFKVDRADDIQSQQSILRDVLERIYESDLIIADLTTANPNVFYELGLAHAFRKPVILVTQSIEEIPFDLTPYRLLEYSTDFVKIEEAKEKLTGYAKGFLEGNIRFGSPVTDFRQDDTRLTQLTDSTLHRTSDKDERGFLDHLIDVTDGYMRIAKITGAVTSDLQDLTQFIEVASKEFTRIAANSSASSPTTARSVARRLAERVGGFNARLKQANVEYTSIADETEDSLEFVVSFQLEQSEATDPQIDEQISSLRHLRASVIKGRDSVLVLADTMDGLPRMERRLNREVARGSEEIRVMARNLDKTIASISRALEYHD